MSAAAVLSRIDIDSLTIRTELDLASAFLERAQNYAHDSISSRPRIELGSLTIRVVATSRNILVLQPTVSITEDKPDSASTSVRNRDLIFGCVPAKLKPHFLARACGECVM